MPHPPRKTARIQLTPDQIEAIRRQTGLGHVPETVSVAIDAPADRQAFDGPAGQGLETERGLIHETNRI